MVIKQSTQLFADCYEEMSLDALKGELMHYRMVYNDNPIGHEQVIKDIKDCIAQRQLRNLLNDNPTDYSS
jgi:hypothetical protein